MHPLRLILVEDDAVDGRRIVGTLEHAGLAVDSRRVDTEASLRRGPPRRSRGAAGGTASAS